MSGACFVFEGRMEQEAMPVLLRPLLDQLRSRARVAWRPTFEGRPDLLKKLARVVRINAQDDIHTFALVDYHPRHAVWTTAEEFKKGVEAEVDRQARSHLHLHFAMHDIESWILCDRRSIAEKLSIAENKLPAAPEAIDLDNPPKVIVRRLFRESGREYRETTEGVELLGALSIPRVYRGSRFFKGFLDDVGRTFAIDLQPIVAPAE